MMGLVLAICMGSCSSWQGPPTRERKETPVGAHGGKTWLLGKMQVGSWPILTPCRQGSGKLVDEKPPLSPVVVGQTKEQYWV